MSITVLRHVRVSLTSSFRSTPDVFRRLSYRPRVPRTTFLTTLRPRLPLGRTHRRRVRTRSCRRLRLPLPGSRRDAGLGSALVHLAGCRARFSRPGSTTRLGGDGTGRDRHRARHPQNRQGSRRLPGRTGRRSRSATTRPGRSLLAAKRYRTEEHRSFHRSTSYVEGRRTRNSRDTRAMAKKTVARSQRRRRAMGLRGVGRVLPALEGRRPGAVPGAGGRHRAADGVHRRRRGRRRAAAGAGPAARGTCSRRTSSSCGTGCASWPGRGWPTATCRRTTCWPRATGS